MKKGKLKKMLATSAMGLMALAMPFALTGCDKDSDINVRVNGDYIQWQVDGSEEWTNLLTIEEVKDLLGESCKGDTGAQGNPGINGREVEFRKTTTHIQWRYVDISQWPNDNWQDLIPLSSLKGDPGQNGETPYIGNNGDWWIGNEDTGVSASLDIERIYFIEHDEDTSYGGNGGSYCDIYKLYFSDGSTKTILVSSKRYQVSYDFNSPSYLSNAGIWIDNILGHQELENYQYGNRYIYAGEWFGESLPSFKNTTLEKFFLGWYIEGTDIEITKYSFIGGDVTLVAKWDEENMKKYFYHGVSSFTYNETSNSYDVNINTENYHYIVIPELFNDMEHGELQVSAIASRLKSDSIQKLECLYGGENVVSIGENAFYNCKQLKYYLPLFPKVKTIGKCAFANSGISTITIVSAEEIQEDAFLNCDNLKTVLIASESISNNLTDKNVFGGLIYYAEIIGISEDVTINESTYLTQNYIHSGSIMKHLLNFRKFVRNDAD